MKYHQSTAPRKTLGQTYYFNAAVSQQLSFRRDDDQLKDKNPHAATPVQVFQLVILVSPLPVKIVTRRTRLQRGIITQARYTASNLSPGCTAYLVRQFVSWNSASDIAMRRHTPNAAP